MKRKMVGAALAAWLSFSLCPQASADACSTDTITRLRTLNSRAFSDCIRKKYPDAKALLDVASALIGSGRCFFTLEAARTFLLLGIVEYAGFKKEREARAAWASALRIRPQLIIPPRLATAALNIFFRKVKSEIAKAREGPARPETRKPAKPAHPQPGVQTFQTRPARPAPTRPENPTTGPARPAPTKTARAAPDRPSKPKEPRRDPPELPPDSRRAGPAAPKPGVYWPKPYMPQDPSLYGLGDKTTWKEYKKGRTLMKVGIGTQVIFSIVGFTLFSAGLKLALDDDEKHTRHGKNMLITSGVALGLSFIGTLLIYLGGKSKKEAGYMIFKTNDSDQPEAPIRPAAPVRKPPERSPSEEVF